jgi:hypothetical protein
MSRAGFAPSAAARIAPPPMVRAEHERGRRDHRPQRLLRDAQGDAPIFEGTERARRLR